MINLEGVKMLTKAVYEYKLPVEYPKNDSTDLYLVYNDIAAISKGLHPRANTISIDSKAIETNMGIYFAHDIVEYIKANKIEQKARMLRVKNCLDNKNFTVTLTDVITISLNLKVRS